MAQQQKAAAPQVSDVFDIPDDTVEDVFDIPEDQIVATPEGRGPDATTDEGLPVYKTESAPSGEAGQMLYDFGKGFLEGVNPLPALKMLYGEMQATETPGLSGAAAVVPKAIGGVARVAKQIGQAQGAEFTKAQTAYNEGRMSEAIGHTLAWLLPVIGPAAAKAGETIGEGRGAEGAGQAAALLLPFGAGMAAKGGITAAQRAAAGTASRARAMGGTIPGVVRPGPAPGVNIPAVAPPQVSPEDAAALAHAERAGVPVDAATASGRGYMRTAQTALRGTTGAPIAEAKIKEMTSALVAEGQRLAGEVNSPSPGKAGAIQTPESASLGATGALDDLVATHAAEQNAGYGTLRTIEADPSSIRNFEIKIPHGTATEVQSYSMALPTDMRVFKRALDPVYQKLLSNPYKGKQAAWLRGVMDGPDFMPASQADDILSSLKAIARKEGGVAKLAVGELHGAVDRAVALGGKDATAALAAGRAATKSKVAVQNVLKRLTTGTNGEPVKIYNRLAQPDDQAIALARELKRLAPEQIPEIGRAMIQDMLAPTTGEDVMSHAARSVNEWNKIGTETKNIFFPTTQRDITTYLHLAKKLAENPNPSGTGHIVIMAGQLGAFLSHPISGIPMFIGPAALAKLLYSQKGVRLLTQGARLSISNSKVAQAQQSVNAAAIMNMVGDSVVPFKAAASADGQAENQPGPAQQEFEATMAADEDGEPEAEQEP